MALKKYGCIRNRDEYFKKMDLIDVRNACGLAGMPESLVDLIWKKKEDAEFIDRYIQYKKKTAPRGV